MNPEDRWLNCKHWSKDYCHKIKHEICNGYAALRHCKDCEEFEEKRAKMNLSQRLQERLPKEKRTEFAYAAQVEGYNQALKDCHQALEGVGLDRDKLSQFLLKENLKICEERNLIITNLSMERTTKNCNNVAKAICESIAEGDLIK